MSPAPPIVDEAERRRMSIVLRRLRKAYPDAGIALHFRTPWELLVATALSAQCTDVRVNQVTPGLFARYPTVEAFAGASQEELAKAVYPTGYHNQKAKALRGAAKLIVERYGGVVPRRLDELVELPGVGRKTAAVVLGNAFGLHQGIAVDTHVGRIVRRLGFTAEIDPVKVERLLLELVPRRTWTLFTHLLIAHGRAICQSRTPLCLDCVLLSLCPEGAIRVAADRSARKRHDSRGRADTSEP
jgi:endonuclease-3